MAAMRGSCNVQGRHILRADAIAFVLQLEETSWLLRKRWWRPADSLPPKVDIDLNAVRYLDKWNVAIHPVVLAVKGHGPNNVPRWCALTGIGENQFFLFFDATYRKVAFQFECGGTGLGNFSGSKRNVRVSIYVKEVLASQFAVLYAAAGVHAICLNFDVQNTRRNIS